MDNKLNVDKISPAALTADTAAIWMATYEVGNPAFRGKTIVAIHSSGQVLVSRQQGEKTASFSANMSAVKLEQMLSFLKDNFYSIDDKNERLGKPDEVQIFISLEIEGQKQQRKIWYDEIWKDQKLKKVNSFFIELASDVSHGEIKY